MTHGQWVDIDEVLKRQQEEKLKQRDNKKVLLKADSKNISDVSSTGINASLNAVQKYNEEIRKTCFKKKDKDLDIKNCHQNIAASLLAINYLKNFISERIASLKIEENSSVNFNGLNHYQTLSTELKNVTDAQFKNLVTKKNNNQPTLYGELKNTLSELKIKTDDTIDIKTSVSFSSPYNGETIASLNDFTRREADRTLQNQNNQYATQLIDYQQVISNLATQNISFIEQSSVDGLSRNVATEKVGVAQDSLFRQQSAKFFELTQKGYFLNPK